MRRESSPVSRAATRSRLQALYGSEGCLILPENGADGWKVEVRLPLRQAAGATALACT